MGRINSFIAGALVVAQIAVVGASGGSVGAAPSPGTPDCLPDPVAPSTAPPVGGGSASISGVVGVEGGDTIEGVTVEVRNDPFSPSESYTLDTDIDGEFSFAGLTYGDWYVVLADSSYPSIGYCGQFSEQADPITLDAGQEHLGDVNILVGPASVNGVVETIGGDPLPNVNVEMELFDTADFRGTQTETDGSFLIAGLPYTEGQVSASIGNTRVYHPSSYGGGGTQFFLDSASPTYTANITVATGGFSGSISGGGEAEIGVRQIDGGATSTTYASAGSFEVENLPAGEYSFTINGSPAAETATTDGASITSGVSLTLPTGSINGTVFRLGAPLDPNIDFYEISATNVNTQQAIYGSINGDGTYQFTGLPDGDYIIGVYEMQSGSTIYHPDVNDDFDATIVTVSGGAAVPDIDVSFPFGPGSISGTVSAGPELLDGTTVAVYDVNYEYQGVTYTDIDGDFTLAGLEPGDYRIQADFGGTTYFSGGATNFFDADTVTITEASPAVTGVTVDFPTGGFSGTLTQADGLPFEEVIISARQVDGDGSGYGSTSPENQSSDFTLRYLSAGDYLLTAQPMIDPQEIILGVFSTDGVTITSGLSLQASSGAISGAILRDGEAVTNGWDYGVTLYDVGGSQVVSTNPDEFGFFRFGSIADGDYFVSATDYFDSATAWHLDAVDISSATVVTVAGTEVIDIDVDFASPPGAIEGTVSGTDASPAPDVRVEAIDQNWETRGSAFTDNDGNFRIDGLPFDTYRLRIGDDENWYDGASDFWAATPIVVSEAEPTAIDINATVPIGGFTGSIVDATGQPFADDLTVSAERIENYAYGDTWLNFGESDFQITGLPAGEYTINVRLQSDQSLISFGTFTTDGLTLTDVGPLQAAAGSISGTVFENGQPIDGWSWGAQVSLLASDGSFVSETSVDESGQYTFRSVADGQYRISALSYETGDTAYHSDGRTFEESDIVEVIAGAELTGVDVTFVPPPGVISGILTNAADGLPIAFTGVEARPFDPCCGDIRSATTNEFGEFEIVGLDLGGYQLTAAPGSTTVTLGGQNPIEIVLTDAVPIADGIAFEVPTGGLAGTIDLAGIDPFRVELIAFANGTQVGTDADLFDGTFEFDSLAAGTYTIGARLDNGEVTSIGAGSTDGITITTGLSLALPGGQISGTVLRNDAPLTNQYASVSLLSVDQSVNRFVDVDQDGTYGFDLLPDGEYLLVVNGSGVGAVAWYPATPDRASAQSISIVDGAPIIDADITLPDTGTLSGLLLDPNGEPTYGSVHLLDADGSFIENSFEAFASGPSGYTFDDIAVGDYLVAAYVPDQLGFRSVRVFAAGTLDQSAASLISVTKQNVTATDIATPAPSTVSGTVTDALGGTVADVSVELAFGDPLFGESSVELATTGPDGTYSSPEFYALDPVIRFDPPESSGLARQYYDSAPAVSAATPVALVPGAVTPNIDAELGEPGAITGTVTDTSGTPRSAFVRLIPANATGPARDALEGLTVGEDGLFTFDDVAPGEWVILVEPLFESYEGQFANTFSGNALSYDDATPFTLSSGGATEQDVVVQPGGSITGVVTDPAGAPLAGVQVNNFSTYLLYQEGANPPFFSNRRTFTGADGSYTLSGLTPGLQVPYFYVQSESSYLLPEFNPDVYAPEDATGVGVTAGGPATVIDVQFERAIAGAVSFVDDDGSVDPGLPGELGSWNVNICRVPAIAGGFGCTDGFYLNAPALIGDQLVFGGFAPGDYRIFARRSSGAGAEIIDPVPFTVLSGDEVLCILAVPGSSATSSCSTGAPTFTASISGVVTGPTGTPQPGVSVTARPVAGDIIYLSAPSGGFSAVDGTYEIPGLPAGDYRIEFSPPFDGPYGFPSFNEWYSTGDDAFNQNFDGATVVTVAPGESVAGIDEQLDLALEAEVTIARTTPESSVSAYVCPAGFEYSSNFGFGGCIDPLTQEYADARSAWSDTDDTLVIPYLPPGDWTLIGFRRSPEVGEEVGDAVSFTLPELSGVSCLIAVPGDGSSTCTVAPLDDEDGVDEEEENNAPNEGDGNNDGDPDSEQESVASLIDPSIDDPGDNGANYVTVSSTEQTTGQPAPLKNVSLVTPPVNDPPPAGSSPQSSLITFEVENLPIDEVDPEANPAVAVIEVFLPLPADSYFKYDASLPAGERWIDATEIVTFDSMPTEIGGVDRWRAVLEIVDGSQFDDDGIVNGIIKDPGVFALRDQTGPTVTCPTTQRFTLGDGGAMLPVTVADVAPPDALFPNASGIESPLMVALNTSTAGLQTVEFIATDNAGNPSAEASCEYLVAADFVDVSQHFDGESRFKAKAGRTVPVTWRLLDASGDVVSLGEPGSELGPDETAVESLFSWPILCNDNASTETILTTTATADEEIRQLGNGDHRLNWRTDRDWAGTCRTFQVRFVGEQEPHTFEVEFR